MKSGVVDRNQVQIPDHVRVVLVCAEMDLTSAIALLSLRSCEDIHILTEKNLEYVLRNPIEGQFAGKTIVQCSNILTILSKSSTIALSSNHKLISVRDTAIRNRALINSLRPQHLIVNQGLTDSHKSRYLPILAALGINVAHAIVISERTTARSLTISIDGLSELHGGVFHLKADMGSGAEQTSRISGPTSEEIADTALRRLAGFEYKGQHFTEGVLQIQALSTHEKDVHIIGGEVVAVSTKRGGPMLDFTIDDFKKYALEVYTSWLSLRGHFQGDFVRVDLMIGRDKKLFVVEMVILFSFGFIFFA